MSEETRDAERAARILRTEAARRGWQARRDKEDTADAVYEAYFAALPDLSVPPTAGVWVAVGSGMQGERGQSYVTVMALYEGRDGPVLLIDPLLDAHDAAVRRAVRDKGVNDLVYADAVHMHDRLHSAWGVVPESSFESLSQFQGGSFVSIDGILANHSAAQGTDFSFGSGLGSGGLARYASHPPAGSRPPGYPRPASGDPIDQTLNASPPPPGQSHRR
ncbi:hypothetical protein RJT17_35170 [Streptomyces sp. P5-A9]|uniref:hypothetical protein n=1 Tax=Streptomyces sp. P5-A9 TaxID=3071730 RepID=UPI002FC78384